MKSVGMLPALAIYNYN